MTDDRPPDRAPREHDDAGRDALAVAASAVVDGVATEVERELVESDPRGPALVERFRVVADAIADVDPVEEGVREEHLAAALAAFGTVGAVPSSLAATGNVRSRWQRPPMRRALAAAAAVLAVGVLGVVVANLDGSTDDDASTTDLGSPAAATAAPAAGDDSLTMMAEDAPDDAAEAFDADSSDPMETSRTESDDFDLADEPDGDGSDDAEPAVPDDGSTDLVPIVSGTDELAELGALAVRAFEEAEIDGPLDPDAPDADLPPTADVLDPAIEACLPEGALPIGPVVYDGMPAFAMVTVGAISGVWDAVVAIDPTECSVLATVPLPDTD